MPPIVSFQTQGLFFNRDQVKQKQEKHSDAYIGKTLLHMQYFVNYNWLECCDQPLYLSYQTFPLKQLL